MLVFGAIAIVPMDVPTAKGFGICKDKSSVQIFLSFLKRL